MCGICGIYEFSGREAVNSDVLGDMLGVLHHRGPDDEGVHCEAGVAIGMRRLSIIDIAGGRQPIVNEDGSIVCVFNGEIYNYRELRNRLRFKGHKFATASDTEVIVHLYEDLGDDCVHELRGMFAFAVWDRRRRRMLVARDRLGIKPLYYTDTPHRLAFASEIKALFQHPDITPAIDLKALGQFLALKYVPAPLTMFEGVKALPPGHLLTCDGSGVSVRQYWDLRFAGAPQTETSEGEYREQLEGLLRESIDLHLVSDVPFGAFLSGGIDSSTVVALMSQSLGGGVKTFAVGFEGAGEERFSELPYARMVAERYQTDHHEVIIGAADLVRLSEKIVWHLDQPIADEAALANYMVAELASRHVKMVLTGEGGDELFAGYARYAGNRLAPAFERLPPAVRRATYAASGLVPGNARAKLALYALCQRDEVSRLVTWFPLFNPDARQQLLSSDTLARLDATAPHDLFAEHLARSGSSDPLHRMLYVDTKLWLPDDLLARGDKTSMAVSIEARIPLLDHKLVEFAAQVPAKFKLRGLTRKYLLKKVAEPWLPPAIISRRKKGFPVPMSLWFGGAAREFVRDLLSPDTIRRRGLFDPAYIARLIDRNESGVERNGQWLWALVNLELWHRLFLDSPRAGRRSDVPARRVAASGVGAQ